MSRITTLALAGTAAAGIMAGTLPAAQAAPLPALSADQVGGPNATVDTVGWRRGYYGGGYRAAGWRGGYYGRRGYYGGYRRRNIGGALAAGAALGLIGSAIAASAAPRYGYYDYGHSYPAYGYPAYGYGYPAYGYGY